MIFVLSALFIAFTCTYVSYLTYGTLSIVVPQNLFLYVFLVSIYLGYIYGVYENIYQNYLYISLIPVFLIFYTCTNYILLRSIGVSRKHVTKFLSKSTECNVGRIKEAALIIIFICACIPYLMSSDGSLIGLQNLLLIMTVHDLDLDIVRNESTTLNSSAKYYYALYRGLLPLISSVVLLKFIVAKKSGLRKSFLISTILITSAILLSMLVKMEPIKYWFILLVAFFSVKHDQFNLRILWKILMITLLFFVCFQVVLSGKQVDMALVVKLFYAVCYRLFMTYNDILHLTFEVFPIRHAFLSGASMPNPLGIFDFDPINYSFIMYQYLKPWSLLSGSAPTSFFAEYYANFGILGCVFAVFLNCIIGVLILKYFLEKKKTIISLTFMAFLNVHLSLVAVSSLHGALLSWPVIVATVFYVIIRLRIELTGRMRHG